MQDQGIAEHIAELRLEAETLRYNAPDSENYRHHAAARLDGLATALESLLAERAVMREAIDLALRCTPFVRLVGDDAFEVGFDCGDPFEILRTALQGASATMEKG